MDTSRKNQKTIPEDIDFDPHYRYWRPILITENTKKNIILTNLGIICSNLERDLEELVQFIKIKIKRGVDIKKIDGKSVVYIPNLNSSNISINFDNIIEEYVKEYVICKDNECFKPECYYVMGKSSVKMKCKACGNVTKFNENNTLHGYFTKKIKLYKKIIKKEKKEKKEKKKDKRKEKSETDSASKNDGKSEEEEEEDEEEWFTPQMLKLFSTPGSPLPPRWQASYKKDSHYNKIHGSIKINNI